MKMTKADVVREFRAEVLPLVRSQYEQDGIPDYPARCEAWGEFTDSLCKDRQITPRQYSTWAAPPECSRRRPHAPW
jgi:hypothetical protein